MLFAGPGGWMPRNFLLSLCVFDFPVQVRCLTNTMFASKVRVAANTKLDIPFISSELALALRAFRIKFGETHPHFEWHQNAFAKNLAVATTQCKDVCESIGQDFDSLLVQKKGNYVMQQKKILLMLDSDNFPNKKSLLLDGIRLRLNRIIHRLSPLTLGHAVNRAFNRLTMLKGQVKPALLVVYFRTLLNGWTTTRRMRSAEGIAKHNIPPCPLCGTAEDSLEHLAYCHWAHVIFKRFNVPICSTVQFLSLDHAATSTNVLALRAQALAALYLIYNTVTHHPPSAPPIIVDELINVVCARPGAPLRNNER